MDLRQNLLDVFQATSVILVFVTVHFGVRYPIIVKDLDDTEFITGNNARDRARKRLWQSFRVNSLPQIILLGINSYMFLPLAIKIITVSEFKAWDFDYLLTAYIVMTFWSWFFFIWSFILGMKLLFKIFSRNLRSSSNN